jgi:predicted ATPase
VEARLDAILSHLQFSEFIYEQPAQGDIEYTFKHALTQEVAYGSVLIERRRVLHERAAQAIEELFAAQLDNQLSQLARHYTRSGNGAKAVEYLQRPGELAMKRSGSTDEATAQLGAALELVNSLPQSPARDQRETSLRMALRALLLYKEE